MNGERPATALRRRDDLEAVGGEHARGRGVDVGEDGALDAACEEPDTGATSGPAAGVTVGTSP